MTPNRNVRYERPVYAKPDCVKPNYVKPDNNKYPVKSEDKIALPAIELQKLLHMMKGVRYDLRALENRAQEVLNRAYELIDIGNK